jgi:hypothetical protein
VITFGYATLETRKTGIDFRCTEAEAIKSVIDWVVGLLPSAKATTHDDPITGKAAFCRLKRLSGHDSAIGDQILGHLCRQGWEPFQVDQLDGFHRVHLRLAKEPAGPWEPAEDAASAADI